MTYTDDAHLFSQYDLNAIISLPTFPQTTYNYHNAISKRIEHPLAV